MRVLNVLFVEHLELKLLLHFLDLVCTCVHTCAEVRGQPARVSSTVVHRVIRFGSRSFYLHSHLGP